MSKHRSFLDLGSGKESRTYIDARGRECRETTQAKRNGDSKYEVKCKAVKHHKRAKHDRHDRYDERSSRDQRCTTVFGTRRCDVASSRSYPSPLPDVASAVIWRRGSRPSN